MHSALTPMLVLPKSSPTVSLPRGGAGDAQQKDMEQKAMNLSEHVRILSCRTRDIETEIKNNLKDAVAAMSSTLREKR